MKKILIGVIVIILIASGGYLFYKNETSRSPIIEIPDKSPMVSTESVTVLATNLNTPWELVFLPDGSALFTERSGSIRGLDKNLKPTSLKLPISGVKQDGEGGLLGLALDPDFSSNKYIYVYFTYSSDGNNTKNKIVRYKFENEKLSDEKILVENIPGAIWHNGGRIKFGPDGYLYATTGDSREPSLAQDKNSLAGKILRMTRDGSPAPGNPFNNLVYSYGHRNPQGISWDGNTLYETEHGDLHDDEINKIIAGGNYGWPTITGSTTKEGMITPIANSGTGTWAPSGTLFYNGKLYFAGLRGVALFQYDPSSGNITKFFDGEFGRLRDVVLGPDNMFYTLTNNTDGRGDPGPDDDKIIRVNPSKI